MESRCMHGRAADSIRIIMPYTLPHSELLTHTYMHTCLHCLYVMQLSICVKLRSFGGVNSAGAGRESVLGLERMTDVFQTYSSRFCMEIRNDKQTVIAIPTVGLQSPYRSDSK